MAPFEYPWRRPDKSSPSVPEPIIMEQTGAIDRGKQFEPTGRLTNIYQVATVCEYPGIHRKVKDTQGALERHVIGRDQDDRRLWVRGISIRTLIMGRGDRGWESDHAACRLWTLTLG